MKINIFWWNNLYNLEMILSLKNILSTFINIYSYITVDIKDNHLKIFKLRQNILYL